MQFNENKNYALIHINLYFKIEFINNKAKKIFGIDSCIVKEKNLFELLKNYNHDCRKKLKNLFLKAFKKKVIILENYTFLNYKNGNILSINGKIIPLIQQTKVNGAIFVFQDVTNFYKKKKEIIEHIKDINKFLNHISSYLSSIEKSIKNDKLSTQNLKEKLSKIENTLDLAILKMDQLRPLMKK